MIPNWFKHIIDSPSKANAIVASHETIAPTSLRKPIKRKVLKKSARISRNHIETPVTIEKSTKNFRIKLTPVSIKEEHQKRVRGYKYLSL